MQQCSILLVPSLTACPACSLIELLKVPSHPHQQFLPPLRILTVPTSDCRTTACYNFRVSWYEASGVIQATFWSGNGTLSCGLIEWYVLHGTNMDAHATIVAAGILGLIYMRWLRDRIAQAVKWKIKHHLEGSLGSRT